MIKLKIFDDSGTYMFPNGEIATPEKIKEKFPAVNHFTHVLELNGNVLQAVMEFNALRHLYKIPDEVDDETAIKMIEDLINNPPPPPPTPEERLASASEFSNILQMEDANTPSPLERIASALEFRNILNLPDKEGI